MSQFFLSQCADSRTTDNFYYISRHKTQSLAKNQSRHNNSGTQNATYHGLARVTELGDKKPTHGDQAMASMTFRFTTECEMTLDAVSYEEAYLQFKDFMRGQRMADASCALTVLPPESVHIFFHTDHNDDFHEISEFKGDFREDIAMRCDAGQLVRTNATPLIWQFRDICLDNIPEMYW